MKQALVILDDNLQAAGLTNTQSGTEHLDYEFCANVHDEWQIETYPNLVEIVGDTAAEAIRLAGEHFHFPCPLAGSADHGKTWADTH